MSNGVRATKSLYKNEQVPFFSINDIKYLRKLSKSLDTIDFDLITGAAPTHTPVIVACILRFGCCMPANERKIIIITVVGRH